MISLHPIATEPAEFRMAPITDEEGAALFRAAVRLFAHWDLTDEDAATLLDLAPRTYARWKTGKTGRLGRDQKTRLAIVMGIHKSLRIIFTDPARGYAWIGKPNDAFSGESALDVMRHGDMTDLIRVRDYLDAARGAW